MLRLCTIHCFALNGQRSRGHSTVTPGVFVLQVQSLMRGWLCRRRWMSIVNEYIKSPHAQMMRTRNRLVFAMVADEEDYVEKLSTLVTVFYRHAIRKNTPFTHYLNLDIHSFIRWWYKKKQLCTQPVMYIFNNWFNFGLTNG